MNITYEEGLLLALYLEFFNRCYDLGDDRICSRDSNSETFARHIEMQNIIYISKCLMICNEDYCFTWAGWKGPYSINLENSINRLDEKPIEVIDQFYEEYNSKRVSIYGKFQESLATTLFDMLTKGVPAMASFVLEDILSQENGSDTLAKIVYIGKTVQPGQNLPYVLSQLNAYGDNPNQELAENIWKDLAILGIRKLDSKSPEGKRLVNSQNGGI